jgi:putative transposase
MRETVSEGDLEPIRHAIQRGQLTGPDAFVEEIEAKLGQRIEFRGPGRPKKVVAQG